MTKPRFRIATFLAGLILGLIGCAAGGPSPGMPSLPEDLHSRVNEYWTLRQAKDLTGMYAYYSAAYRSRRAKAEFLKKTRLIRFPILDFDIVRAAVSGEQADVTVRYRTVAPPMILEPFESEVSEPWVRDADGRWYKEKETLLLPFPDPAGNLQLLED